MGEITKQIRQKSKEFPETKPLDYHRYLVISLGTGLPEQDIKFDACRVAKWGIFGWLGQVNTMPLLQMFLHASSDMTDSHVANLFKAIDCSDQLLRIQVCGPSLQSNFTVPSKLLLQFYDQILYTDVYVHLFLAGPQHTNRGCAC